jgi:probable non-F420 flavinoid oxidoreductase
VTSIGYHASLEQHPPHRLLRDIRLAEEAGFRSVSASDPLSPTSGRQGQSGFVWSWLGAAMQRTTVPFGVITAPGQRYHPVILAQAIATLLDLFPRRLWVALGAGEALHEHVTGERWADRRVRDERLRLCVEVIRGLLRGDEVTVDDLVRVDRARLWTLPPAVPQLAGVALGVGAARWCARWSDALVTVNQHPDRLRALLEAFRESGGAGKPVRVLIRVAWAPTEDEALAGAFEQWRTNLAGPALVADLDRVEHFELAAAHVRPEDVRAGVLVSSDPHRLLAGLHEVAELGVDELLVHQVPVDQPRAIEMFGEHVLPAFHRGGAEPERLAPV